MREDQYKSFIKSTAMTLGFEYCGIAKADFLSEDAKRLEKWLKAGMNGSMKYMENYFDLRTDPRKLVPDASSVITLLCNYYPNESQRVDAPKIAKYAYGKDYHEVIKEKLHRFLKIINENIGEVNGRGFVDSAPVLERSWAVKSGLGWIGKNGNLINKQNGSFYFIATLITDLNLEADDPIAKDYCGSCTKCIDVCPTDAILPNKVIDGSKCISYYTIELKEALIPDSAKGKMENWIFGCDSCQDVCPWNRFSKPNNEIQFTAIKEILSFSLDDWQELNQEAFKKIFKDSPIKRTKFQGLRRNIKFLSA